MRRWKQLETSDCEVCIKKTEKGSDFKKLSSKNLFYLEHACSVAKLCLALCDLMDYSLPDSSVHGDSPGKNTGVGSHERTLYTVLK